MEICEQRKIPYTNVHSTSLKKWVTDNGRASKEDMIDYANRFTRKIIIDDNEADAIHIARWGAIEGVKPRVKKTRTKRRTKS